MVCIKWYDDDFRKAEKKNGDNQVYNAQESRYMGYVIACVFRYVIETRPFPFVSSATSDTLCIYERQLSKLCKNQTVDREKL